MSKTKIDHIAIHSNNIKNSVKWYLDKFDCDIQYQDDTWALLNFENISLALVTPDQHPAHFAIVDKTVASNRNKKIHRDGISYIYTNDPDSNTIEVIDRSS
tara:strand:+ start:70828 stop:71130 length:303 start_codon:yes stop_codon:yes gene_type:complete